MEGRVMVTVPEGWTLERVDIKNGMGAVELDSLEVGPLVVGTVITEYFQ